MQEIQYLEIVHSTFQNIKELYKYITHIYLKGLTSVTSLMKVQNKQAAQYVLGYVSIIMKTNSNWK